MCIRLRRPRKLDTQWKYLGSSVFENNAGDRIHLGGKLIRLKGATAFNAGNCSVFRTCCRLMGSTKRGLMLYAEYCREDQEITPSEILKW